MTKRLWIPAAFIGGLAVGVVLASHVWLVSVRFLREGSLAEYQIEQEFLASRSAREGDRFNEAIHRLNVADAQAAIGFRWLERSRNQSYWEWFELPWESYWSIRNVDLSPDDLKHQRGRDLIEAENRAAAAIALERWGQAELAHVQWSRVSEIQPSRTRAEHLQLYELLSAQADAQLEDAYLDSKSYPELESALARLRERSEVSVESGLTSR